MVTPAGKLHLNRFVTTVAEEVSLEIHVRGPRVVDLDEIRGISEVVNDSSRPFRNEFGDQEILRSQRQSTREHPEQKWYSRPKTHHEPTALKLS